jgi:hypothetical protein
MAGSTTRSFRGPLVALAVGVLVLLLAMVLDRGGAQSRDLALLLGVAALYVLLPIAVIWLIVVAILRGRSARGGSGRGGSGRGGSG